MMVTAADGSAARRPLPWTGMQPLRWDRRPDGLRAPALVCAFKGWNDAGESASSALTFLGAALGAERFAVIDPEEFVDFQATRPTVRLSGGQHARDRVARHRGLRGARAARAARPRDPLRPRAGVPLAHVLRDGRRARRGARRADGRDARRAARRRPALAPGRRDRVRRPTTRWSSGSSSSRRPTRARPGSSACCTTRARTPACRARRCGPRCRTTSPSCRTRRARSRCCAGSRACRRHRRRRRARGRRRRVRAPGLARRRDGPRRAGVRREARARGRRGGGPAAIPRSCRRATCSRASSSASCASAGNPPGYRASAAHFSAAGQAMR